MTADNEERIRLIRLMRAIARATVKEAATRPRTTGVLSGAVEAVDTDLDTLYLRIDQEAMGTDPTQSDNYGAPGIIAASRIGEALEYEQARVDFNGPAGATAMRTSTQSLIILPYGVEAGQRIELDGVNGNIKFFDESDNLVGYLDATQWYVGTAGASLARLDPLGGLRLRDENGILRVLLSSAEGLTLRDAASGISGLIARPDGLIVLDPETGDRISISSGTTSVAPTPHWKGSAAVNPGATHSTPALVDFDHGDDLDLRFVCASSATDVGSASYTPPAGYTELADFADFGANSLAAGAASLAPAPVPSSAEDFTSTSSAWTRANGHTVIVHGDNSVVPSVRATATSSAAAASPTIDFTINAPLNVVEGEMIIAFVALSGPSIPVGWTVPDGWIQLGVQVAGIGTSHILASGVWYKIAGPSEPSSELVQINMSAAGFTRLKAITVAVQNPYLFPGGLDIRRNNRSMPRGQVKNFISTTNTQWTNTQLPQTLDTLSNVELLAGRSYAIKFFCPIYEFANLNLNNVVRTAIEMDTGSGFTEWLVTDFKNPGGVERGRILLEQTYVPTVDQTIDLRVRASNEVAAGGHEVVYFGANEYKRELSVTDVGAAF